MEGMGVNAGVTRGWISILIVVAVPHCPLFGVNVYVVVPAVAVPMVAGLQVPVTPLSDVVGRAGGLEFKHSGPICLNTGAP